MKTAKQDPIFNITLVNDLEWAEDLSPLNANPDSKRGNGIRIDSSALDNILASDICFTIDDKDLQ